MNHDHAVPIDLNRHCDLVAAQSGNPDAGEFAQHARTAGARHRRVRLRTGAGSRASRRENPLPGPPAAFAAGPVSPVVNVQFTASKSNPSNQARVPSPSMQRATPAKAGITEAL